MGYKPPQNPDYVYDANGNLDMPATQAKQTRDKYIASISKIQAQDFGAEINSLIPNYSGIYKQAYDNLGQTSVDPSIDTNVKNRIGSDINALRSEFIKEYKNQSGGQDPSPQIVQDFLSESITPSFAQKSILGTLNSQNIRTGYSKDAAIAAAENAGLSSDQRRLATSKNSFEEQSKANVATQRSLLEQLARLQEGQYVDQSNQQFGQSRGRLISDLAASGRAYTPQATETISRAEQENQRSLTQALANIRASQVGQQIGVEQQGQQNVMQGRQFDVGTQQQNKQFGIQRQSLAEQIRQFNEGLMESQNQARQQRELASYLGRLQANSGQTSRGSKVAGGALTGAAAGASMFPLHPALGAAGGAVFGGLSGLF